MPTVIHDQVARLGRGRTEAKTVQSRSDPSAVNSTTWRRMTHDQAIERQAIIDRAPHARSARTEAPKARSRPQSAARPAQHAREGVARRAGGCGGLSGRVASEGAGAECS